MTKTREKCARKAECRANWKPKCSLRSFTAAASGARHKCFEPKALPIRNDSETLSKPGGGFWTSTYHPNYGSGWVRYCVGYRYNDQFELHWTVLSVSDSADDLAELINRYPRMVCRRRGLDFERVSLEYEGLDLTHQGYLRTRSRRHGPALIGWDCESTLRFRWVFTERYEIRPYFKHADQFENMWLTLSGWSAKDYRCHRMPEEKASKKVYEAMLREDAAGCDRWL